MQQLYMREQQIFRIGKKSGKNVPHEIDPQTDAQFNEKLVHLTNISSIPMRIEHSGGGHGVPDVDGHDLGAAARRQPQNFDVLAMREGVQEQEASGIVPN